VLVLGVGLLRVNRTGQREAAHERAIRPLDTMVVVLLHLVLKLALALEVQGAVLDADLDLFRVHARELRLQHYVVLGFVDVHRRSPGSGAQIALVKEPRKGVVEQPVEPVLRGKQITEWFPAYNRHSSLPPWGVV